MFRRETVHSHFFVHFSPFLGFLLRIVSFARSIGDFSARRERVVGESSHRFVVQCALLRQVLARFASSRRAKFGTGASWRAVFGREEVRRFFVSPRVAQKAVPPGWKCRAKCSGRPGKKTWKNQTRKASYSAISPIIRTAGENKCRNAVFRCYYSLTLQS